MEIPESGFQTGCTLWNLSLLLCKLETVMRSFQGCWEEPKSHVQSAPQEALRAAGGEPDYPPRAPFGHPPAATMSVRGDPTAARDLLLICPFIALHTIRGSLEGLGGWADGKQREKTKASLRGGQKAGCLLPPLPVILTHQCLALATPRLLVTCSSSIETSLRPHMVSPLAA